MATAARGHGPFGPLRRPTTAPCTPSTSSRSRSSAGEVLGIVGESGCGKTVDRLVALRLLPETRGDQRQRGLRRHRPARAARAPASPGTRRARSAFVFQEPMTSLNPVFTVGGRSARCCADTSACRGARRRARTIELLRLVGIPRRERRLDEYPHQLSGGMRQRVMIAMALACDPKVLIADEPTTALDVTIQAGILDLMRDIRERLGTAIVLITHNLGVVADIADRVLVMYAGPEGRGGPGRRAVRHAAASLHDRPARRGPAPRRRRGPPRRGCARSPVAFRSLARAARRLRVRRPLPARRRRCAARSCPSSRECPAGHVVACFHPGTGMTPRRGGPALEVVDLVKHYRGGGGLVARRARSCTPSTASRSRSAGRDARARRRVGQRQVDDRELHAAARRRRRQERSGCGGDDITHLSRRAMRPLRRELHIVFQDPFSSLNPRMTCGDIVGEPLRAAQARATDARCDSARRGDVRPGRPAHRAAATATRTSCRAASASGSGSRAR